MTVRVEAIDHVQLLMPDGPNALVAARAFYGAALGLEEVLKPRELADRGGLWFRRGTVAIHLAVEPAFRPATRSHPAIVVADLVAAREALRLAGIPIVEDGSGLPAQRIYVADPFGNRIELIDAADAGFTDPARRR